MVFLGQALDLLFLCKMRSSISNKLYAAYCIDILLCYVLVYIIRIYQKSCQCFQGKCGTSWSDSSWESSSCSNFCRLHDIFLLLRFVLLLRHVKIERPLICLLNGTLACSDNTIGLNAFLLS